MSGERDDRSVLVLSLRTKFMFMYASFYDVL